MAQAQELEVASAVRIHRELLLDTCILISEFNSRTGMQTIRLIPRAQRRTSVLALWEFLHGTGGATLGQAMRTVREGWLDDHGIQQMPLHPDCSKSFNSLLRLSDAPPGAVDCLLAAECLARGWPLVTANLDDFRRVRGLKLVPPVPPP